MAAASVPSRLLLAVSLPLPKVDFEVDFEVDFTKQFVRIRINEAVWHESWE